MMKDHRGGGIKLRHKGGLLIVRKQVEGERLGWVSRNHSDTVQRQDIHTYNGMLVLKKKEIL